VARDNLSDLTAFAAVARERSFTRAAAQLGVSPSALSQTVRGLEGRLGVRLLTRTTRSVALTEAGERLMTRVAPHLDEIGAELAALGELGGRPLGSLRITTSDHAARTILWPAVERLTAAHPDIRVELHVESRFTDIVAERFDAGVRLGEQLAKDMVAVRIGPRLRMAAVASPAYLADKGVPRTPQDLADHNCINVRFASAGGVYAWEFEKEGRAVKVRVEGQLTFNRVSLMLQAAAAGRGIAFVIEDEAAEQLRSGALVRVLDDWCEPFDGYHLYYPSRRLPSPAFTLLVDALRYRG
jgi:DNA-binding transcriptional LysR family regulator